MATPNRTGGQQAALLFLAAGALTIVNNYLPGSEHLDKLVLNSIGVLTCLVGWAAYVAPWGRWSRRSSLVLAPLAFAMIGFSTLYGGVGPYSHAVFFIVVFAWIGVAHPPKTGFWLVPFAATAYVVPLAISDRTATGGVASVTVAIPVCLLVAETIARSVHRLRESEIALVAYAEQLERRQAHEQAVIDSMPDGMAVLCADGLVCSWNSAAAALTGRSSADVVGMAAPFDLPMVGDVIEHQIDDHRWIEIAAAPLPTTGESVVTFRDITRQKALDKAKDVFLATTSHELRTPLTVVKGYVATLRRHFDQMTPSSREEALRTVEERTDGLISLVDHLLAGSRASSELSLRPVPVDLAALTQTLVDEVAAVTPSHDFTLAAQPEMRAHLLDPGAVSTVIGQLLENAVKYSPAGSRVEISVGTGDDTLLLAVADRGIGIPAGDERQIFEPFYQAGAVNRRQYGGVGLGLYIVDELVQAHGGTTQAANRAGGGSVFTVTLPAIAAVLPRQRGQAADGSVERTG